MCVKEPYKSVHSRQKLYSFHVYLALDAGLVGLGLTYSIALVDILQHTVGLSAEVENVVTQYLHGISFSNIV